MKELNMKALEKVAEELQSAVFECDKVEYEITESHVKFIHLDDNEKDVEFTISHDNLNLLMNINLHRTACFILNYLLDKKRFIKYKGLVLLKIRSYCNGKLDRETVVNYLETIFKTIDDQSTKEYYRRDVLGFLNDIDKQRKKKLKEEKYEEEER